jgi:4-hydroxy 2-oxovalerate aldolase
MTSTSRSVTLLDCTLRDGGYYTNWEFDDDFVGDYIETCNQIGVDVVELGYVRLADTSEGRFARLPCGLTPELRERIHPESKMRFAAMINAADAYSRSAAGVGEEVRRRLDGSPLPIDIVRVAVRYADAARTADLVESLRGAGFSVGVNLMQIDLASATELEECVEAIAELGALEVVYLADSLGSLRPDRARALAEVFVPALDAPIGFHAHDNQGLALHNSIAVREAGVAWLDSTMGGMGRGAGNPKTEQLLTVLADDEASLKPAYRFVAQHMGRLQSTHGWGASPYYAISGQYRVHPTYVQRLEAKGSYDAAQMFRALEYLSDARASHFSAERLEEARGHASVGYARA